MIRSNRPYLQLVLIEQSGATIHRMQETGKESNVYKKLHISPLESKLVCRDLKMYLVIETSIF